MPSLAPSSRFPRAAARAAPCSRMLTPDERAPARRRVPLNQSDFKIGEPARSAPARPFREPPRERLKYQERNISKARGVGGTWRGAAREQVRKASGLRGASAQHAEQPQQPPVRKRQARNLAVTRRYKPLHRARKEHQQGQGCGRYLARRCEGASKEGQQSERRSRRPAEQPQQSPVRKRQAPETAVTYYETRNKY